MAHSEATFAEPTAWAKLGEVGPRDLHSNWAQTQKQFENIQNIWDFIHATNHYAGIM